MTLFDDREHAFENRFAHEAELEFRAEALRLRMIAYWATELMGETADFGARYARTLMHVDLQHGNSDDVVARLLADLDGKADEATVRARMGECLDQARAQVRGK